MTIEPTPEQEFWERRADAWHRRIDVIGHFSDTFGHPAMETLAAQPGERVLDIGSGPGTTAIELARRVAPGGEVVGVDIAEGMVAGASRRAADEGVANVRFVAADVERSPLGTGYDAAFSRFGIMFFPDPVAAFANIAGALRPGGRLAGAVWGPLGDNPWMFVPTLAAAPVLGAELALPGPGEPGPFSLAEPERITTLLSDAGFHDVTIAPVTSTRLIEEARGRDSVGAMLEVGPMGDAYAGASEDTRAAAVDAVVAAIEAFRVDGGWSLPGHALVIGARRP